MKDENIKNKKIIISEHGITFSIEIHYNYSLVHIESVIENFVAPALMASGFHPSLVNNALNLENAENDADDISAAELWESRAKALQLLYADGKQWDANDWENFDINHTFA